MSGADKYWARKEIKERYPDPTPEMIETQEFQAMLDLVDDWYISYRRTDHYVADGAFNFIRGVLDTLARVRDGSYKAPARIDEDADEYSGREQAIEYWKSR